MGSDFRGDFSRLRFNPQEQYTAVLEQQGRVALDADANEQRAIDGHLRRIETIDVIGEFGAPHDDAGFAITVAGGHIEIGPGRYYVDGLMCENRATLGFDAQRFFVDPPQSDSQLLNAIANSGEGLAVYLEVWQRLATVLDDPCLREPALGLADTTARLQTVWRVVGRPLRPRDEDCCSAMYEEFAAEQQTALSGTMSAQTGGAADECSCEPIAAAGYHGLENQLYRVEVHHFNDGDGLISIKWSRENGFVLAGITSITGATVAVTSLGPDANLGFLPNQWVEIFDDADLFGPIPNAPGTLYQIQSVDAVTQSLTLTAPVAGVAAGQNARVRRWDQSGSAATSSGIAVTFGVPIPLENGIEVTFAAGTYEAGCYWTIPARTATGQIEWPPCGSDGNPYQPAQRTTVSRAPLACIHAATHTKFVRGRQIMFSPVSFTVEDCRRLFYPLTDLSPPPELQALHVTGFNWANDDITTFDQVIANGITVDFDSAPTGPINGANFIITVEPVAAVESQFGSQFFEEETGALQGAQTGRSVGSDVIVPRPVPQVIPRAAVIIDSDVTTFSGGTTISYQFHPEVNLGTIEFLNKLIARGATVSQFARARVRLLGRTIFAVSGLSQIFLDGQAFGALGTRADGATPRINLALPSGNGEKGSDFEGWFYVAPVLEVVSVTIDYPNVIAVLERGRITLFAVVNKRRRVVAPTATVTVSYPAIAATAVGLQRPPPASGSGKGVVEIPPSTTVAAASTTATFPISVVRWIARGEAEYTITAALNPIFDATSASATFTVTYEGESPPKG